jgi:hypothetical protein
MARSYREMHGEPFEKNHELVRAERENINVNMLMNLLQGQLHV